MAKFGIALCILLAISVGFSLEEDSSQPEMTSITGWTLVFYPLELSHYFLRAELNSMLSNENKNACTYFNETLNMLADVGGFVKNISHTIYTNKNAFDAALQKDVGTDENQSRMIFHKWLSMGLGLQNKYMDFIRNYLEAAFQHNQLFLDSAKIFAELKNYQTALENCINAHGSVPHMISVLCTMWPGLQILKAQSTFCSKMLAYKESVKNLEAIKKEVEKNLTLLLQERIHGELKSFNDEARTIVEDAISYVDRYDNARSYRG